MISILLFRCTDPSTRLKPPFRLLWKKGLKCNCFSPPELAQVRTIKSTHALRQQRQSHPGLKEAQQRKDIPYPGHDVGLESCHNEGCNNIAAGSKALKGRDELFVSQGLEINPLRNISTGLP